MKVKKNRKPLKLRQCATEQRKLLKERYEKKLRGQWKHLKTKTEIADNTTVSCSEGVDVKLRVNARTELDHDAFERKLRHPFADPVPEDLTKVPSSASTATDNNPAAPYRAPNTDSRGKQMTGKRQQQQSEGEENALSDLSGTQRTWQGKQRQVYQDRIVAEETRTADREVKAVQLKKKLKTKKSNTRRLTKCNSNGQLRLSGTVEHILRKLQHTR